MTTLRTKNSFQSQIREELSVLSNEALIAKFKELKAEQQGSLSVSFSMALAQVITVYKRELVDRGVDYLAI